MSRALIVFLGLIALGLLCLFCIRGHAPSIQTDLIARTGGALAAAGLPWASANADGRELVLQGVAPSAELRKRAGDVARRVWGVRTVDNHITVAIAKPVEPPQPVVSTPEPEPTARVEPPQPVVSTPEPSPVVTCQQQFDALLGDKRILFETDSATLQSGSTAVLDELAVIAARCPGARIEVAGHTDARGDEEMNQFLSQARAESVTKYLIDKGVDAKRLSAVGYGESQPIADNITAAGLARNRRIEFRVEEN